MMDKLYLVTGANGHLGYTIAAMLRKQAKHVRGLILPKDNAKRLQELGVELYEGDVTKPASLIPFFQISDTPFKSKDVIVIHTAGIVSISQKKNTKIEAVNVYGTMNVVTESIKQKVGRFIHVSSVHAIPELQHGSIIREVNHFPYQEVMGSYAQSKAKASEFIMQKIKEGFPAIICHPSGIIGPDDIGHGHMTMMIEDYLNGFLTSRVEGAYDFVDVRDVAKGIISAAEIGHIGSCYILSGTHITLNELFDKLKDFSGRKRKIHVLPRWFAKLSAPLAEVYYRLRGLPPIYSKYSLYTLSSNSHFSYEKAGKELNYVVRPIYETLKDTVTWLADVNRVKRLRIKNFIQGLTPLKKKSR
jgi:dihydroflavonol-4-reductase